jgi:RNase P/RNase MRP subunit p30
MFDIIICDADAKKHGFERFYPSSDAKSKIIKAENLEAAANHKNKPSLIILNDYAFDEGAIKVIAEKKKLCFLIDLSVLIRSYGVRRAILMSKLRTFLSLCNRFGAFYAFASFADKEEAIRSPEEIMAMVSLLGINPGQAKFALRMLPHYL